jgi:hypothetical protein
MTDLMMFTYQKMPGWYPSKYGGFTRKGRSVKLYDTASEALDEMPKNCKLVEVYLKFKVKNYASLPK